MEIKDAVVVVSGASSGIGEATAYAFEAGAKLVLASRDAAALQLVAKRCRELGTEALVVPTDVTNAVAVEELAERALSFGAIDVWVSNAGVGAVGAFENTPARAHEQVIRTNLIGHINDAHAALPIFKKQRRGVFINMISAGGFAGTPYAAAYSASKFGLRGLSEALRGELANEPDIHVCDIYPTFVDTPGLSHGANYTGRKLTAPPPLSDPRYVASVIVATARNPQPTTYIGVMASLIRIAHFLAPNLGSRLAGFAARRYFRRAERVPLSSGNLFRPPQPAGGIDGGLRRPDNGIAFTAAATAAGAGVLLAALFAYRLRARSHRR